jgi:hypothetical protein
MGPPDALQGLDLYTGPSAWKGIRVRLQLEGRTRDLAMFNLAIDSKLGGCDLVRLRIEDVFPGGRVRDRATVIEKKTGRPVQFVITKQTRAAIGESLPALSVGSGRHLFPRRFREPPRKPRAIFGEYLGAKATPTARASNGGFT